MKEFTSHFTEYKNCIPPGVRLPQIKIEEKYYKSLDLDVDVDNFTFLKKLCEQSLNKNNFLINYSTVCSNL